MPEGLFDKIIIGAGVYGLYGALQAARRNERVLVLEKDSGAFQRATYVNQARVHMGYHYPRSYATASKCARYFDRFNEEYSFCVKRDFRQIYATSSVSSWTSAGAFRSFCESIGAPCMDIDPDEHFNKGLCDGAFMVLEYTYDACLLRDHFLSELAKFPAVEIEFNRQVTGVEMVGNSWHISTRQGVYASDFVLNCTYAGVNELQALAGFEPFDMKYELCEIILCKTGNDLAGVGFTVMDGPFFSIMPFGKTGVHSLTSVSFTPHSVSYENAPLFDCQKRSRGLCKPEDLYNCNLCPAKPKSAWPFMSQLARKYLLPKYEFEYLDSLFSMKPILKASEVDDSRPTTIKYENENPTFVSVLSGKVNGIFDLDKVLGYE